MPTTTRPGRLLVEFRGNDIDFGVTREILGRLAVRCGLSETQVIHLAVARLAREELPGYEPDDGPLTSEQMQALRVHAQALLPDTRVSERRSLF